MVAKFELLLKNVSVNLANSKILVQIFGKKLHNFRKFIELFLIFKILIKFSKHYFKFRKIYIIFLEIFEFFF